MCISFSRSSISFNNAQDILQFFKKFNDSVGKDLQFVIDDLSAQDSTAVGVTWHLGMLMEISYTTSFLLCEIYVYPILTEIVCIFDQNGMGSLFPSAKDVAFISWRSSMGRDK